MKPAIPKEVLEWVRGVFLAGNISVTNKLTNLPTTQEEWLDIALINEVSNSASPMRFASDWVVNIATHYLGGRQHFYNWEIADVGVLIVFRQNGKVVKSKVALLQSKRLYPNEEAYREMDATDYQLGFAGLFKGDAFLPSVMTPRKLTFSDTSRYEALKIGDGQYAAIEKYEKERKIPVYYLLYNPRKIPHNVTLPLEKKPRILRSIDVGARVISASHLRSIVSKHKLKKLSFGDINGFIPTPVSASADSPGWRLEEFIVDLVLQCKAGYLAKKQSDQELANLFYRRSGPIGAVIAVTFDAPE